MQWSKSLGWSVLSAMAVSVAQPAAAGAALTHRYSFDDGTANDSVGGANGVLMNGATVSGGQLRFDPAVNDSSNDPLFGQYVNLPYNLITTPSFTIEAWATEASPVPWQRILDLSDSANGYGQDYLILTPYNNPGTSLGQLTVGGMTSYASNAGSSISTGVEHEYAYVHSTASVRNVSRPFDALYIDGHQVATGFGTTVDATTAPFNQFWIGRSGFAADPYYDGTINELRVYGNVENAAQVAADYQAGPDAVIAVPDPAGLGGFAAAAGGVALAGRRRRPRGQR